MQVNAQNIADLIGGTVEGDPDVIISKPCKIEEGEPGGISFLGNPKYEAYAYTTQASALLVGRDFVPKRSISATLIRVENVYAAIAQLLDHFGESIPEDSQGDISPRAEVHPEAVLEEGVSVGPFAVIEAGARIGKGSRIAAQVFIGRDARIGENCRLSHGVRFLHACEMGRDCFLHPNVVVGSDGFGFAPQEDGSYRKISQVGNVIIGDEVEIGSNTTIDRATMGATRIGNGVKLDNLIMIAHNVEIGDFTVIAGQSGIAGSTKIGKHCRIGGQVGFSGHLTIADGTQMQAQSGVGASIREPGKAFFGTPAIPYKDYIRSYGVFKKLPELYRKIGQLERLIKELKAK
jgi:UDP-3-O-[3-hydroxymyristoyl] glucosamine N-acyltransferase